MASNLLLLEDVDTLGRSGQVVSVKPGYARNYLIPRGMAIVADKNTIRFQERLKEERSKKALDDKKASEEIAARLEGITLTKIVKVDHEGHMYGSVNTLDIIHILAEEHGITLDKKFLQLKRPVKELGMHDILVKLKEDVTVNFQVKVISEEEHRKILADQAVEATTES